MTAYAALAGSGATSSGMALTPVSYEIRIIGAYLYGTSSGGSSGSIGCNTSIVSSPSGGTSVTPVALRGGSSAASTTAKANPTGLGTQSFLWFGLASGNGGSYFDGTSTTYFSGGTGSWQPPTDLIISPGSSFYAQVNATSGDGVALVWFEELRLSWPY